MRSVRFVVVIPVCAAFAIALCFWSKLDPVRFSRAGSFDSGASHRDRGTRVTPGPIKAEAVSDVVQTHAKRLGLKAADFRRPFPASRRGGASRPGSGAGGAPCVAQGGQQPQGVAAINPVMHQEASEEGAHLRPPRESQGHPSAAHGGSIIRNAPTIHPICDLGGVAVSQRTNPSENNALASPASEPARSTHVLDVGRDGGCAFRRRQLSRSSGKGDDGVPGAAKFSRRNTKSGSQHRAVRSAWARTYNSRQGARPRC
jgi:hypothetical protein